MESRIQSRIRSETQSVLLHLSFVLVISGFCFLFNSKLGFIICFMLIIPIIGFPTKQLFCKDLQVKNLSRFHNNRGWVGGLLVWILVSFVEIQILVYQLIPISFGNNINGIFIYACSFVLLWYTFLIYRLYLNLTS